MRRILFVFCTIILGVTAYVGWRLMDQPWQWAVLGLIAFLLFLFPVVQVRFRTEDAPKPPAYLERVIQASFVAMGLFSWLFVVALARDCIMLILVLFSGVTNATYFGNHTHGGAALAIAASFTIVGMLWAFRGLRIKEVKIAGFPGLAGLRIAQITDLHVGSTIGEAYVERVVAMVEKIKPDITVLTGDIVDGDVRILESSVAPFARLAPKGKVFYVPGNHEFYSRFDEWKPVLERLGMKVLMNRGERVQWREAAIWVGGVPDTMLNGTPDAPNARAAMKGGERDDFRVLLSHRPELAHDAARAGFQLQLSGHTHGGQFFPWTIVAKFFHEYFLGLMKHENMWIYVSPGTGSWGPPVRIGTTPEVTCIVLV